jgi:hypothetical protein
MAGTLRQRRENTMTTLFKTEECCFICGNRSEHHEMGSSSEFGSPDLDLRPAPMMRSTVRWWVHRCPTCGYCAPRICDGPEIAKQIIGSPEYISRLSDPAFTDVANHFRCHALIQTAAGNHAGAGWAALNAAWICDDDGKEAEGAAQACRREAIASFTTAREAGQQITGEADGDMLLLADLNRRTGQFAEAVAICNRGIAAHPRQQIFLAQRRFAQDGDKRCHTMNEAYAAMDS